VRKDNVVLNESSTSYNDIQANKGKADDATACPKRLEVAMTDLNP
jgi:hypothetical protein